MTKTAKIKAAYQGIIKKNKTMTSPKKKLVKADLDRWIRNTIIFFAPALILFLTQLAQGVTFQEALPVLYLWLINTLIDVTRKYLNENTYKEEATNASK
jgi:hypothetical protein